MKQNLIFKNGIGTLWYRIRRYPGAALISLGLALIMAFLLCYLVGRIYPDFKLFNNLFAKLGAAHNEQYNFYSGEDSGTYYKIGKAIEGRFQDDGDMIHNCKTGGGYDNAMKVTIEGNSFGLIQQEMMKDNDQLRSDVKIITPIFLERMHIFYRKELLKKYVNNEGVLQLSPNMSASFLSHFNRYIRHISVGPVGSASQILSSYVLQLIDGQIASQLHGVPRYRLTSDTFGEAFSRLKKGSLCRSDSVIDILFYVGADPIDDIRDILNKGEYALMSINPSFITILNKEFDLNLRVADFNNKYDVQQMENVSTIGTMAYLIASKSTPDDDVMRMLKRIDTSKTRICRSLITLHGIDTLSYINKGKYLMPLSEYGFFKSFKDEYEASRQIKGKELFTFLLSVIGLFFPVLRSVNGIGSAWNAWYCNKQIDQVSKALNRDGAKKEADPVTPAAQAVPEIVDHLSDLKMKIIDLYGDGNLLDTHYNRLTQRIAMHIEKLSFKPGLEVKLGKTGLTG